MPSNVSESKSCTGHPKQQPSYIVAIGASAGGLEAIQDFFDHMPANTGAAFVIIQHLSPDFKSLMDQLLSRNTDMTISLVEDGMFVEQNTIYLIPPKQNMQIQQGHLKLTEQKRGHYLNLPIDIFFESLAKECGGRGIAVVLSGTGSDGSKGVVEVSKAGGLTLVQDPESAKFDGMPRNAIATKFVDRVLAIGDIPSSILEFINNPDAFYAKPEIDMSDMKSPQSRIFALLMSRHKVDFSLYKSATMSRRIERRLQALNLVTLEAYVDYILNNQHEIDLLYKDLLIGVTEFFRDKEVFSLLSSHVVPAIIRKKQSSRSDLRIWVPACSTGEEAYSLAMIFRDYLIDNGLSIDIKIFATDINKEYIDIASSAIYSQEKVANISEQRLEKYFSLIDDGRYQINPEIRNMVVFAQHNLVSDPPFTRMDLVSCRNFLIYIQPYIQKKILGFLRFSVNVGGFLLLGPSETLGDVCHDFDVVNSTWKLFEKIAHVNQSLLMPKSHFTAEQHGIRANINPTSLPTQVASSHTALPLYAYDLLLDRIVDDGLLIDQRREVLHVFGDGRKYISFDQGRVTTDVIAIILPEMKSALTTGLHRVNLDKVDIKYTSIPVKIDGENLSVSMKIQPLLDRKERIAFILIQFLIEEHLIDNNITEAYVANDASEKVFKELEYELEKTKESLQATIEELETTNEELQSTNEELLASNEELQSTNEELHSVNEELYTVNAEHQKKIEELMSSNNDIDNFIRSTDIGTLFVDSNLIIKRYTPAIASVFDLLPQDIGRGIDTFTYKIQFDKLIDRIKAIIKSKEVYTKQIQTNEQRWFVMRIQPYLVKGGGCEGAVITFFDIHDLKMAHKELIAKESRYRALIEATSAIVWEVNQKGEFLEGAQAWCKYTGQNSQDITKNGWLNAVHAEERGSCRRLWKECIYNDIPIHADLKVWSAQHKAYHYVRLQAANLPNDNLEEQRWVCSLTDIDAEKRFDEKFRLAVQASPFSSIIVDERGMIYFANEASLQLLGYKERELIGHSIEILIPEASREMHIQFRKAFMKKT